MTINYKVPGWNFCNEDTPTLSADISKNTCKFCQKTKAGHICLLYEDALSSKHGFIDKTPQCIRATANLAGEVDEPAPTPVVPPKILMKKAIDLYGKTLNDLMSQGYPRAIADEVAKKYVLGDN